MTGRNEQNYEFGDFRLETGNPTLWQRDKPVSISPKALATLILLVERHGKIVSREELLETVWRDTFVEEANINYTISLLRKTLSPEDKSAFIQTVPKRGYRFVAEVREITGERQTEPAVSRVSPDLPANATAAVSTGTQIRWHFIGIILLGVIFLSSFAIWWRLDERSGLSGIPVSARNIRSVAILPLKTLNEHEKNDALAMGLTDSLISRLGSLNVFVVRPLNSVAAYADTEKDPLKFGFELQTDAVLEGTLQQTGSRLRVNLRLWDVRDGAQLWQDSFDTTEAEFFRLQDSISNRVAESLRAQMIEKDRRMRAGSDTQIRAAFDAYWRGRFFLDKRNTDRAAAEFQKAIALDPNYALAYAGLADAYIWQANFTHGADAELYAKAKTAVDQALALDADLADAHSSLARIKYSHEWDWRGAEEAFRRAIELNPNNVGARQYYARLLTTLGRYDEALTEIHKARELDPRAADLNIPLSGILEKLGRYDDSINLLQSTLEIDKDSVFARRCLGNGYLLTGDYRKVIEMGEELFPKPNEADFWWSSMLATAYFKTGQFAKFEAMRARMRKMAESDPKWLYFMALSDSETGRAAESLAALEKALAAREERMIWTKDEPRFANVKNDPRFRAVLAKLNLE